jgi:hypothetical protein
VVSKRIILEECSMSERFTYNIPDEELFYKTLIKYLECRDDSEISNLLKGGRCNISNLGYYSQKRWDALYTEIYFYVPFENFPSFTPKIKKRLLAVCDDLIPKESGLDVMCVEASPLLDENKSKKNLITDLEEISNDITYDIRQYMPDEIKEKGKEMTEVYLYLYCIENTIRTFIEEIGKSKIGDDYFEKINIPNNVKKNIQLRKDQESKNQWLSLRGNSDIYYLDFKDLSTIITNNWDLFKSYFPDQAWIATKIEELGNCRNLVAHNSYLEDHEKDLIKLYYHSILKQISSQKIDNSDESADDLPF